MSSPKPFYPNCVFLGTLVLSWIFLAVGVVDAQPSAGLVAWYTLDNDSLAVDSSGVSGPAILVGAPSSAADRRGSPQAALLLDGDDYVRLPSDYDLLEQTISIWFYRDSKPPFTEVIYDSDHGGLQFGSFKIVANSGNGGQLRFNQGGGILNIQPFPSGRWTMATIAADSLEAVFYVNGQKQGAVPRSFVSSMFGADYSRIGTSRDFVSDWMGRVDDFRLYNRCLDSEEVYALYANSVCASPRQGFLKTVSDSSATLVWHSSPRAIGYRIKGGAAPGTDVAYRNTSDTSFTVQGLTPGSTYYWTVRAACALDTAVGFGPLQVFSTPLSRWRKSLSMGLDMTGAEWNWKVERATYRFYDGAGRMLYAGQDAAPGPASLFWPKTVFRHDPNGTKSQWRRP